MAGETTRLETAHTAHRIRPVPSTDESPLPADAELISPQRQAQWLLAFLLIGLAARSVRYLLRFPLWEDEAMLATNFFDCGYLDLLKPMKYGQVARRRCSSGPSLRPSNSWAFLNTPCGSCRLFAGSAACCSSAAWPGCSCAGPPWSSPSASSPSRIRPSAMRPRPSSMGATSSSPWRCSRWRSNGSAGRTIAAGSGDWRRSRLPAVGFSFPALFIGGGVSLVVGYALWRSGRRGWLPWFALNLLLAAAVLALLALDRVAVGTANQAGMDRMWQDSFPPLAHPIQLIGWFLGEHTGSMLAYPVGGPGAAARRRFSVAPPG